MQDQGTKIFQRVEFKGLSGNEWKQYFGRYECEALPKHALFNMIYDPVKKILVVLLLKLARVNFL